MRAHRATHAIATMSRVLGVSCRGLHAWCTRPVSARAQTDAALLDQVRAIHTRSRGTDGVPRVPAELAAQGVHVGRKPVPA
jgi:hypothetical protein